MAQKDLLQESYNRFLLPLERNLTKEEKMKCEHVLPNGVQCTNDGVERHDAGHVLCDKHYADYCKTLAYADQEKN